MRLIHKRLIAALTLLALCGTMLSQPTRVQAGGYIRVTTTSDEANQDANCSLREAIIAANENIQRGGCAAGSATSMDTIYVPAGTFFLFLQGINENDARSGDLDINQTVAIYGAGVGKTRIDASSLNDRVFQVRNAGEVLISGLEIRNGNLTGHGDTDRGGAIFNSGSTLRIWNVLFDNNKTDNTGGTIDNDSGSTTIINRSTISGGSAKHGGGVFNQGLVSITESLLTGNSADLPNLPGGSGGAIDNNTPAATLVIINSTLVQNTATSSSATSGGAAIFSDGNVQLHSNTIVKNNGVALLLATSTTGYIVNTIVAGNSGGNCDASVTPNLDDLGYNLRDTTDCNFLGGKQGDRTVSGWAAVKVSEWLQNNGGPTLTLTLLEGSPAIDNGVCDLSVAGDQRMNIRPWDGDLNGSKLCDIGAFEYLATPRLTYLISIKK